MSQITESRSFFKNYDGKTEEVEAKYAKFVFFGPKVGLSDLLNYQASIDKIEVEDGASESVVESVVENLGQPFAVSIAKQLSRRFKDDRRNWENRAGQPSTSISGVMRQKVAEVLEGTSEEQQAFLSSLELFGGPDVERTKEYIAVATAMFVSESESESDNDNSDPEVDGS